MRTSLVMLCLASVSAFAPTLPLSVSARHSRTSWPVMQAVGSSSEYGSMQQRRAVLASALTSLIALPSFARANELSELFAQKSPNEVVQYILDQLKTNDAPAPDAGLQTLVKLASATNPATQDPVKFIDVIKKSPYSILLGKYDAMRMAKANEGILRSGNYGATVTIRLDSTVRKFAALGVDQKFLFAADDGAALSDIANAGDQDSKLFCIMEFQLSKDPTSKAWLVDSVYFVPIEAMRA